MSSETKVKVWKLDLNDQGTPLIVDETALPFFAPELLEADPGDVFTIEVAEMSRAELAELPEWDGW